MRVPIEWLKELVSFRAGADQLAEMLTGAGLETVVAGEEVLEVDVLPNRADAWSLRGIAREVSALTKFKTKTPKYKLNEAGRLAKNEVKVEVRDKELCPRYLARVIENIKVNDSPEWLKRRLEAAGIRPINNVVDVTNYLLHEIGQPLHAFDAALIQDRFIIVRRANPAEKIIALDGKEYQLDPETLVIADPEKAIAIAGIIGGGNTEVSLATKTIILESAFFDPVSIHRSSQKLKVRTEASIRFQHGVDWLAVEEALDRAAALIAELGRGEVLKGKVEVCAKERHPKTIFLRPERVARILGGEIPEGEIALILKRLGFTVKKADRKRLAVTVPLFRAMDIEREIDLIEEVARIWGYGRIAPRIPQTAFPGREREQKTARQELIREILVGCGLNEVQTYSFLGPKDFDKSGLSLDTAVKVTNPLTVEGSILRSRLLPGLLNVLVHNQNRQVENVFIFEIGKVFNKAGERWAVAGLLSGSPFLSAIDKGEVDYYYLKGIVETIFKGLGLELPRVTGSAESLLQPGKGAEVGEFGIFGALHPDIAARYELVRPAFFFELDLEKILLLAAPAKSYRPLPRYPSVTRDISFFIPSGLENQQIIDLILKSGGELVEKVFPFDKYKDSVAYRVIYRHPERTLTEEEVNRRHQEVVEALTSKLLVRIR